MTKPWRVARGLVCALAVCATGLVATAEDDNGAPAVKPASEALDAATRALIWNAADAAVADFAAELAALEKAPDITWKRVAEVLRKGRPRGPDDRAKPLVTEPAQHAAYFAKFPWVKGRAGVYPIGDDQPYWSAYHLPANYDAQDRVPVWFDIGGLPFGAQTLPAPGGWAFVSLHPLIHGAAQLGSEPISMTAGSAGQSIVLSVVADLERHFRVDRDRIFAGGYSRYGNASWYFACHWPDLWAGVNSASGFYPFAQRVSRNPAHLGILAACGDDRGHRDANRFTRQFHGVLTQEKSVTSQLHAAKGRVVGEKLETAAWEWMKTRRRNPLPRDVAYTLIDERHGATYRIEILGVKDPGNLQDVPIRSLARAEPEVIRVLSKSGVLRAQVTGKNAPTVSGRNVKRARIYLSPELFDLDTPIALSRNTTSQVKPEPSIATLLRNFRKLRDPSRLFPAEIDLSW